MLKSFTPALATIGAVAMTIITASHAHAVVVNQYLVDDGSSESAVGFRVPTAPGAKTCVPEGTLLGDFMWLNEFDVLPGAEVIDSVSIAWGTPSANPCEGQPLLSIDKDANGNSKTAKIFLYQYDETNKTLNLLTQTSTKVEVSGPSQFVDIQLDQAKQVSGKFFIGALFPGQLQGQFPAALDVPLPGEQSAGRSWIGFRDLFSQNPSPKNSVNFNSTSTIPLSTFDKFTAGNWLLRANGRGIEPPSKSVPESSPAIGLLAIGALGAGALLKRLKKGDN